MAYETTVMALHKCKIFWKYIFIYIYQIKVQKWDYYEFILNNTNYKVVMLIATPSVYK